MPYIEQEQQQKESSKIKKIRKNFIIFRRKKSQNISLENKEISKINLKIKEKIQLIDSITKEIKIENQVASPNQDVLEMHERMFEHLKREINDLKIEQIEIQNKIDEKDLRIDNSFQYQYVTRL